MLFTQGFAITLMSQMGVMIIFALSYNMLLGQSGMLSFGHAVYSGLGAYVAVHTLNLAVHRPDLDAGVAAAAGRRTGGARFSACCSAMSPPSVPAPLSP